MLTDDGSQPIAIGHLRWPKKQESIVFLRNTIKGYTNQKWKFKKRNGIVLQIRKCMCLVGLFSWLCMSVLVKQTIFVYNCHKCGSVFYLMTIE